MTTQFAPAGFISAAVNASNWCVASRATPRLLARYGTVLTRGQYAKLQACYRCGYTPEAARYEVGL